MVGKRLLLLLAGCFLTASAALADEVGFIDCREHPEQTQVFAKARHTHEIVATLACGERFTILLNGFIFSRIQTRDGQVGYVFSNVISADHSGASVQKPAPAPAPAAAPALAPVPAAAPSPANSPAPIASAQPTPTSAPAPEPAAKTPEASATVAQPNPAASSQTLSAKVSPAPTPASEPVAKIPASSAPETSAPVAQTA